jgi:hypothetical protein
MTLGVRAALGVAALLVSATGCAPAAVAAPRPRLTEWREARARLHALRAETSGRPRTIRLALELREPFTGRVMQARGAVALSPPDALRMILLGPGGTTALDLWAKGDRFRFAVPAIDLLRRGDATTPRSSMRGLPVDFLRWWLLDPFGGELLAYERTQGAERFVLREEGAVVHATVRADGSIEAVRETYAEPARGERPRRVDAETVSAEHLGCATVRYAQQSTHLSIRVRCEGEERERAPSPRAFEDPDGPGGAR